MLGYGTAGAPARGRRRAVRNASRGGRRGRLDGSGSQQVGRAVAPLVARLARQLQQSGHSGAPEQRCAAARGPAGREKRFAGGVHGLLLRVLRVCPATLVQR